MASFSSPAPTHTFGNFARLYARYVRDEKLLSTPEAIRKMTSLRASNLAIDRCGLLKPGATSPN